MIEYFEKPLWEWVNSAPEWSQRETSLIMTKERLVVRFTQQAVVFDNTVFLVYLNFAWKDLRRELELSRDKPSTVIQYYIDHKIHEMDVVWKRYIANWKERKESDENRPV